MTLDSYIRWFSPSKVQAKDIKYRHKIFLKFHTIFFTVVYIKRRQQEISESPKVETCRTALLESRTDKSSQTE